MVLLRHMLADGSSHFDWVLGMCGMEAARGEPEVRDAVTFRLADRVDEVGDVGAGARRLEGERLPDHRRRYLWYEGEIEPGRGRVERVASGWWKPEFLSAGQVRFAAQFERGEPVCWRWSAQG